jgi:hypothetical protein
MGRLPQPDASGSFVPCKSIATPGPLGVGVGLGVPFPATCEYEEVGGTAEAWPPHAAKVTATMHVRAYEIAIFAFSVNSHPPEDVRKLTLPVSYLSMVGSCGRGSK